MDWFLYDNGLCHERVKIPNSWSEILTQNELPVQVLNSLFEIQGEN